MSPSKLLTEKFLNQPSILKDIVEKTLERVEFEKSVFSAGSMTERADKARKPFDFVAHMRLKSPAIIAEIKYSSPSESKICEFKDPCLIAGEYLKNGASALSILTEPSFFKGDIRFLKAVRDKFPDSFILMKDFIVDPYQLDQARILGADAILLIAALFSFDTLTFLYKRALSLGLTVLLEVHDREEMKMARELGALLIGANNRNLKTMEVSLDTSRTLGPLAPVGSFLISESGIKTAQDIKMLKEKGFEGFLIGTEFMKTPSPGASLKNLMGEFQKISESPGAH